jgi:pilus assembly protein FimV
LTSASTAEQKEDARVAAAKEIAEIQSRVDSLQQNVQQLKDALNQGAGAASGTPGSPGTTGSAGTTGSTGTTGATGATGTTGTTGTTGSAGATGSVSSAPAAGAPGAAGSADATGATAASSANGSAGSASSAGSTTGTTSQSTQHTLAQLWSKLTTSAVGILTLILGFGGLLVAWLLRRASARREQAAVEGDDLPEPLNPNARTALDQKLQAIDLNLDTTSATTKIEPSLVNPSASPKA